MHSSRKCPPRLGGDPEARHIEELSSCRISASEGVGVEAQIMVKKGDEELYISSCRMSAQRE